MKTKKLIIKITVILFIICGCTVLPTNVNNIKASSDKAAIKEMINSTDSYAFIVAVQASQSGNAKKCIKNKYKKNKRNKTALSVYSSNSVYNETSRQCTVSSNTAKQSIKDLFGSDSKLKKFSTEYMGISYNNDCYKYYGGETECNFESKILKLKKISQGKYIVTKKYYFYSYWGYSEPTLTFKVKYTVVADATSNYGYRINKMS